MTTAHTMKSSVLSDLNFSDIPEMMPGAFPGANPAARFEFVERCKEIHLEDVEDDDSQTWKMSRVAVQVDDLIAMFPSIDAVLIDALVSDSPTPQHAMETLLALVASTSELAAEVPARHIGADDLCKFPCLIDGDGWQLPSRRGFELDVEAEDQSVWRDLANNAKNLPSVWGPRKSVVPRARRKLDKAKVCDMVEQVGLGAFELRQVQGERRAKNIAKYGRRNVKAVVDKANSEDVLGEDECDDHLFSAHAHL